MVRCESIQLAQVKRQSAMGRGMSFGFRRINHDVATHDNNIYFANPELGASVVATIIINIMHWRYI